MNLAIRRTGTPHSASWRWSVSLIVSCLLAICLTGCAFFGTTSIRAGRLSYAEAIAATNEEQLLQLIVRDRYDRQLTPLKVSSITANIRFSTNMVANFGIGPDTNYERNLVPLSAGVAYEENPIISYSPIDSSDYLRQLLSPVPLEVALLVLRSAGNTRLASLMLLERINGLKNPNLTQSERTSDHFERAVDTFAKLFDYDVAEFVALGENKFGVLIHVEEIKNIGLEEDLLEFMRLLELNDLLREAESSGRIPSGRISGQERRDSDGPDTENETDDEKWEGDGPNERESTEDGDDRGFASADADAVKRSERGILVISIRFSAVTDGSTLALTTRSVYDMLRIASASIDVPPEDIESGKTVKSPFDGLTSDLINIRRDKNRPREAVIASKYDDWWYYIDPSDISSRQYFRALGTIWSALLASAEHAPAAPLLTVPVSR